MTDSVRDYESAAAFLAAGRDKNSRPIENNTRIERRGDNIAVRLHGTDVVTYFPDGTVELSTGGWYTVTTKDRINRYAPVNVYSERGRWMVSEPYRWGAPNSIKGPFFDGVRVKDGEILNPLPEQDRILDDIRRKDIEKQLSRYIKGFLDALEEGTVNAPGAGDCWMCSMFEASDLPTDPTHYLSHFEEEYYVGHLLWNAVKERGYGDPNFVMGMRLDQDALKEGKLKLGRGGYSRTEFGRDLRRYLKKRLLPGGGVTPVGEPIATTSGSGYYGI